MKHLSNLAPLASLALAAATLVAAPAQAAVTGYTDPASFLAAVQGGATDSFDDLIPFDGPASLTRSIGTYGYTIGALGDLFITANPGLGSDSWVSTIEPVDPIVIDGFSGGVAAAGMFLFSTEVSGGVIPAAVTATATDSLGGSFTFNLPSSGPGTFVGFVSTGLLVSVTVNSSYDLTDPFVTVNDLTLASVAAPIPEPGTWALLAAGLGVVGLLARRRRG